MHRHKSNDDVDTEATEALPKLKKKIVDPMSITALMGGSDPDLDLDADHPLSASQDAGQLPVSSLLERVRGAIGREGPDLFIAHVSKLNEEHRVCI
jgi:hypothetical protein